MLHSSEVPQADILSDVIETVRFVQQNEGANFRMIANYIGKGERQGRYYRHAAQILGFIENYQNHARILPAGEYCLSLSHRNQKEYLRQRVMGIKVFDLVIQLISTNPGCGEDEIEQLLTDEGITISTGDRRTSTIISWLVDLDIIRQRGDSLFLK